MNIDRRNFLTAAGIGAVAVTVGCSSGESRAAPEHFEFTLTDAQWAQRLSPAAYGVLRHGNTERPFTSPLNNEHRAGTFLCGGCALPLFASSTKFDSGTGWPSFWAPLAKAVILRADSRLLMDRTEVRCRRCGGHLGHVFNDGPPPTLKRYCMNGVALTFQPKA